VNVAECRSNHSISTAPKWNLSTQSDYSVPINANLDGYVRGPLTFYPSNPNQSIYYVVPSYAMLNLYLGARSPSRVWDASVFVKNATNTQRTLSLDPLQQSSKGGSSGSEGTRFTPERQFGVNARHNFGGPLANGRWQPPSHGQ
jgi:iron complex outermembrane receptor protein